MKIRNKVFKIMPIDGVEYFTPIFASNNILIPFGNVKGIYLHNIYKWCKGFIEKYESELKKEQNKSPLSKEMIEVILIRKEIVGYQDLSKRFGMEDVYFHSINNRKTRIKQLLKQHFERQ